VLLEGKSAVVYGAGGAIGSAVAKAFAAEGARVALTGRSVESLEAVRAEIGQAGGQAEVAVVDAHVQDEVEEHLQGIIDATGRVDISFNAVSPGYVIGDPLTEESAEEFAASVQRAMRTQFVTATAAGRQMAVAGSGVILTITATPAHVPLPNNGSLGVVGAAIEAFCRQLAVDLGPRGVRVVCLRSAGSPDAPGVDYAMTLSAERAGISRQAFEDQLAEQTLLKRLPRLAEVGAVAALMASDRASAVTATVANVTCGQIMD
jgi:NAD(P)-dependent dehydrogenase (short-subunit alcohol dehydrogenase family)